MNERIKQLALQAQKVVGYTDGGYTEIKALDQEKFAELIVRECADIVADAVNHREPASTYVEKIKQHFGVEE